MSETDPRHGNDNRPDPGGNLFADTVMALRFYSRLPTGNSEHEVPHLSRIAMAVPFASLIIGGIPALVLFVAVIAGLPPLFAAVASAGVFAVITGAMSEDALADACDGLFGGATPEKRLEILKDSRHGTYGVLAIVFLIGLKVAALSAMAAVSPLGAALCWLAAGILARSASLYLPLKLTPARASGAAAAAGQVTRNSFALGLVFASIIGLVLAGPFVGIIGLAIGAILVAVLCVLWTRLCDRLIGGLSGDLIGALQALLEIALLATFMRMVIA